MRVEAKNHAFCVSTLLNVCDSETKVKEFSSVDGIHFTLRTSLHTMLKENEDRSLSDTTSFAFYRRLVY